MGYDPLKEINSEINRLIADILHGFITWETLRICVTMLIVAGILAIALYLIQAVWLEIAFLLRIPEISRLRSRLRTIRKESRARGGIHPAIQELNTANIGLVLSGGGAKGAYEIGVVRALRYLGLKQFHAVAGTSVGALNGILLAQDDLKEAQSIWQNISFNRVMALPGEDTDQLSGNKPLLAGYRRGKAVAKLAAALAARLLLTPFFVFRKRTPLWLNALRYQRYLNALASLKTREDIELVSRGIAKAVVTLLGLGLLIAVLVPFTGWDAFRKTHLIEWAAQNWIIFSFLGFLAIAWLQLDSFHNAVAAKLALFSNQPLQNLVRDKVQKEKLIRTGIKAFVTQAYRAGVVRLVRTSSPEAAQDRDAKGKIPLGRKMFGCKTAIRKSVEHVPFYATLNIQTEEDIERDVVQSAGLPEIFPLKSIRGEKVVDGGMADNTPLLPILREKEIRNIVVIYLDKPEAVHERLQKERVRLGKMAERIEVTLEKLVWEPGDSLSERVLTRRNECSSVSRRILPVIPSLHLGNMANGTMLFFSYRARRLILLGYWDTLQSLENGLYDFTVSLAPAVNRKEGTVDNPAQF